MTVMVPMLKELFTGISLGKDFFTNYHQNRVAIVGSR